ncbi:MAG: S41 family peptidase [Bacteroidota bacterium]
MMQHLSTILCLLFSITISAQSTSFLPTKKAIADLDDMVQAIEDIHYNPYFLISQDSFQRYKSCVYGNFDQDSISIKEFVVAGKKLTAALSGGHTGFYWENDQLSQQKKAFHFVPFTGTLNAQNQFVVSRSAVPEIKVGAVIEHINGRAATDLFREAMTYIGGIENFKKAYVEDVFPAYLFYNDALQPPYTIQLAQPEKTIEIAGLEAKKTSDWLYAEQPTENYTFEILDGNIGVIGYNSCQNMKAFKRFLKATFQTIEEEKIDQLIIDIRQNGGGNSGLNDRLLAYLTPKSYRQMSGRYWKVSDQAKSFYTSKIVYRLMFGRSFMKEYTSAESGSVIEKVRADDDLTVNKTPKNEYTGKHCFLIGPRTFSSANMLADAIKTYDLSTLIGETTGELTNDFGEQLMITLPYSQATLYVSSTYDIGANGNPDLFQAVEPDIQSEDALETAIEWLQEN